MVAGGSTGIGQAVALRVASEGATVVVGACREDVGEKAGEIRTAGGRAIFVPTDVAVEAEAASLVRAAITEHRCGGEAQAQKTAIAAHLEQLYFANPLS